MSSTRLVSIWFELVFGGPLDINLCLGTNSGSRPVTPTLRLSLSEVYCPFRDLAELAERAATNRLPFEFEIESEGPVSVVSLRAGPIEGAAIFEVREANWPVFYFAATVDALQFGLALAHALRFGIENPANRANWDAWSFHAFNVPSAFDYFGNAWLRDVCIDHHPSEDRYYDGIDQANQIRYQARW